MINNYKVNFNACQNLAVREKQLNSPPREFLMLLMMTCSVSKILAFFYDIMDIDLTELVSLFLKTKSNNKFYNQLNIFSHPKID